MLDKLDGSKRDMEKQLLRLLKFISEAVGLLAPNYEVEVTPIDIAEHDFAS